MIKEEPKRTGSILSSAAWNYNLLDGSMAYSADLPRLYHIDPAVATPENITTLIMEKVLEEDRQKIEQAMKRAMERAPSLNMIFRVKVAEGDIRYFNTINGPVQDGRYLFGTTIDITSKMQKAESQRLSSILQLAESSLLIGFIVVDFVHHTIELTDGVATIFGDQVFQLPGEDQWNYLTERVHPSSREWFSSLKQFFLPEETPTQKIVRFNLEDNGQSGFAMVRFNQDAQASRRIIILHDITEDQEVAIELQKQKLMLDIGGHAANIGSYVRHIRSDTLEVTDRMLEILDVERKETSEDMRQAIMERIHPEDRQKVLDHHQKSNRLEPYDPFEYRIVMDDGNTRWIMHRIDILQNEEYLIGTIQDVTAEVQRRKDLEETNRELEQLVYTVSHDLRAPIRHITAFTQMTLESLEGKNLEEQQEHLGFVLNSAGRLANLIDDLLQFSRIRNMELRKEWVDVNPMVASTMAIFQQETLQRRISWVVEELPMAFADPRMLEKIFLNLISNAVKFTGKTSAPVIRITGWKSGTDVVFQVADNGAGFDMAYSHKLYSLFQRLHSDEEFEGTGIGLANAYKIIHRHGGQICAEGHPGKGASFSFSLPFTSD